MKCDILFSGIFSNSLEKSGKREMGQNSSKTLEMTIWV